MIIYALSFYMRIWCQAAWKSKAFVPMTDNNVINRSIFFLSLQGYRWEFVQVLTTTLQGGHHGDGGRDENAQDEDGSEGMPV